MIVIMMMVMVSVSMIVMVVMVSVSMIVMVAQDKDRCSIDD
jgi:hypothetical protein